MLIAIEGGDGVGKSTLMPILKKRLDKEGAEVLLSLKFPNYSTTSGAVIRKYLGSKAEFDSIALASLYGANKNESRKEMESSLYQAYTENKIVLVDRWVLSNIIYQGVGYGKSHWDTIAKIEYDLFDNLRPDLNIILTLPSNYRGEVLSNRNGSGNYDRYDTNIELANYIDGLYRFYVEEGGNEARATRKDMLIECAANGVRFTGNQICDKIIEQLKQRGLL